MAMNLPRVNVGIDGASVFLARNYVLDENGYWRQQRIHSGPGSFLYMHGAAESGVQENQYLFVYESWGEAQTTDGKIPFSQRTHIAPSTVGSFGTFSRGLGSPTGLAGFDLGKIDQYPSNYKYFGIGAGDNTYGVKPLRYVVKATTTIVGNSSISGTVLDINLQPLSGQAVYLINIETSEVYKTAYTNFSGFYNFVVDPNDIITKNPKYKNYDPNPFDLRVSFTNPAVSHFGLPGYIPKLSSNFQVDVSLGFEDNKTVDMTFELDPISLEISTPNDLFNMRYSSSSSFVLMNDIDLHNFNIPDYHPETAEPGCFLPINNYYEGNSDTYITLDGQGHAIHNMFLTGSFNIGLFSLIKGSVKNLVLDTVTINSFGGFAGSVAGELGVGALIEKCGVTNVLITGSESNVSLGGFVGSAPFGNISKCFSKGSISGTSYTGGFVGDSGANISDCYAVVNVSGSGYLGVFGYALWGGTVTNCYGAGTITGNLNYGFGGSFGAAVTNCYWDADLAGQAMQGPQIAGLPRTTAQMTFPYEQITTYIDWDFANVWGIDSNKNSGYPFLLWQFPEEFIEMIGNIEAKSTLNVVITLNINMSGSLNAVTQFLIKQGYSVFVKHDGVYVPAEMYVKKNGSYTGEVSAYKKKTDLTNYKGMVIWVLQTI